MRPNQTYPTTYFDITQRHSEGLQKPRIGLRGFLLPYVCAGVRAPVQCKATKKPTRPTDLSRFGVCESTPAGSPAYLRGPRLNADDLDGLRGVGYMMVSP